MNSFKPGDRVVRINTPSMENASVGMAGTVYELKNERTYVVFDDDAKAERKSNYNHNLQLEHIYNSPLAKALR